MVGPFTKLNGKTLGRFRGFILKSIERAMVLLKSAAMHFQISSPFERLACFYVTIRDNFERLQYFNFEEDFLENGDVFQKTVVPLFN